METEQIKVPRITKKSIKRSKNQWLNKAIANSKQEQKEYAKAIYNKWLADKRASQ